MLTGSPKLTRQLKGRVMIGSWHGYYNLWSMITEYKMRRHFGLVPDTDEDTLTLEMVPRVDVPEVSKLGSVQIDRV